MSIYGFLRQYAAGRDIFLFESDITGKDSDEINVVGWRVSIGES